MKSSHCDSIGIPLQRQRESMVAEYFDSYLKRNPATGFLTFAVYEQSHIRGRLPLPDVKITVSKLLGDNYYLSKIMTTNKNGETEPLALRTVSKNEVLRPEERQAYTSYYASLEAPGYQRKDIFNIQIFEGITTLQEVELIRNDQSQISNLPVNQ